MDRFFRGDYDVEIAPLTPFPQAAVTANDPFEYTFGTDTFSMCNEDGTPMDHAQLLLHAKLEKWFREGTGNTLLQDVPHPRDKDGNQLPHGAVLKFDDIPIRMHPRKALVWWLRLRHVNVPGGYPMEPFQSPCGADEPGLVGLVQRALDVDAPCMSVEEVQRLGALDPVGVQIDEGRWLSLETKEDGPEILSIVNKLKISDDDIGKDENGLFGLRATDRTRAMYLFRGGNIVSESVRFTTGTTRGPNRLFLCTYLCMFTALY